MACSYFADPPSLVPTWPTPARDTVSAEYLACGSICTFQVTYARVAYPAVELTATATSLRKSTAISDRGHGPVEPSPEAGGARRVGPDAATEVVGDAIGTARETCLRLRLGPAHRQAAHAPPRVRQPKDCGPQCGTGTGPLNFRPETQEIRPVFRRSGTASGRTGRKQPCFLAHGASAVADARNERPSHFGAPVVREAFTTATVLRPDRAQQPAHPPLQFVGRTIRRIPPVRQRQQKNGRLVRA